MKPASPLSTVWISIPLWMLASCVAAQEGLRDTTELGSVLGLKVLLSSEDVVSASRYESDSEFDFETQQLGLRWRLGDHRWLPFLGVFAGRYVDDLSTASTATTFEAVTGGVEAGAEVLLAGANHRSGWFLEPRAAVGTSWIERRETVRFDGEEGPAGVDGSTADARALTMLASLGLGRRWESPGRWRLEGLTSLWWLRTDPHSVDAPLIDRHQTSTHLRLQLSVVLPLTATFSGRALELAAGLVHTELDDDFAEHLAVDRMTEASLSLLTRFRDGAFPVGAFGLAVRYLDADSFDGWTLGVTVSD
ncbi:MAG: autotransporter outer membrane beta-barrel domain-containing protein [Thermoanaerobaculia bacterium]|nr:autotransporter outer membrane beta-barrel domain-containing protein [Thermoanaerobaculia bacterium]